jgi:hypothetical protein
LKVKSINLDRVEGAQGDQILLVGLCHGLAVLRRDELPGHLQGEALVAIVALALAACYAAMWFLSK